MRVSSYITATVVLALLLSSSAQAETAGMVLGHAGQLQRALTGAHGELFPGVGDDRPALAVETVTAAGEATRMLVPGTLDPRIESAPLLFQDTRRDAFVTLWRSLGGEGDSQLRFATFDGAEWSEVFTLEQEGAPVALADEPLIAETHDTFELDLEDGETIHAERRVLHLLWRGGETRRVHYAPLTFVEGRYVGWHGLLVLDDTFLQAPDPAAEGEETATEGGSEALAPALGETLSLRTASDGRSLLVTFANPASQRLGVLEIRPLPLELELLGEQVREHVFALAELFDPDDLSLLSDGMRAAIVITGHTYRLNDAQVDYVAGEVADWILESQGDFGWSDLELLGDGARGLAIDAGREVFVSTAADPADASEIVRIDVAGLLAGEEPDPAETLDFRLRCDLPAPAVGDGPVTVHASRTGDTLLVAWEDPENGRIHWVESAEGAWSETFSLVVGESLAVETAHELLAKKIR